MSSEALRPKALVVIPAYRESARLPRVLRELSDFPPTHGVEELEIRFLVVDDGSGDAEAKKMLALIQESGLSRTISLLRLPVNRGKGGALRAGFEDGLRAGFDYIGFMDADGSVPLKATYAALKYIHERAGTSLAGVAGSRIQMLGRDITRNFLRHYVSRVFASFVSFYFNIWMYDSQCGLKIFKAGAVKKYLAIPTDFRWVWDTQLVLAMLHGGETLHELPIDWHEVGGSKVSFLIDPLVMLSHLVAFRPQLRQIPRRDGSS